MKCQCQFHFLELLGRSPTLVAQKTCLLGHILDLYCILLSNAAPSYENYTKLYFDAKHLEKRLNRGEGGVEIFGALFLKKLPFFIKKCPFWPIFNAALNF